MRANAQLRTYGLFSFIMFLHVREVHGPQFNVQQRRRKLLMNTYRVSIRRFDDLKE